jgi:hypothetical protein
MRLFLEIRWQHATIWTNTNDHETDFWLLLAIKKACMGRHDVSHGISRRDILWLQLPNRLARIHEFVNRFTHPRAIVPKVSPSSQDVILTLSDIALFLSSQEQSRSSMLSVVSVLHSIVRFDNAHVHTAAALSESLGTSELSCSLRHISAYLFDAIL